MRDGVREAVVVVLGLAVLGVWFFVLSQAIYGPDALRVKLGKGVYVVLIVGLCGAYLWRAWKKP